MLIANYFSKSIEINKMFVYNISNLKKGSKNMININNKGVSLVALVITIIVLLILAGITLTFAFGDNGIITKAKNAKRQTEIAQAEETINLKISELQAEKDGQATIDDIDEIAQKNSDITIKGKNIIYKEQYIFEIDESSLALSNGTEYTPTTLTKAKSIKVFDDFNKNNE